MVAVGAHAEQLQGVGADLRLDARGAQRGQRLVAAVELHDVGLPAVAVALVGRRERERQVGPSQLGVGLRAIRVRAARSSSSRPSGESPSAQ